MKCEYGLESSKGMVLPEENVEHGKELFISLQCTVWHIIRGLELPKSEIERPVELLHGGRVTNVKSYVALVSSIVNPSHNAAPCFRNRETSQDGKSPITIYNDIMTVTELVDIVAFLPTRYEIRPIARYRYVPHSYTE